MLPLVAVTVTLPVTGITLVFPDEELLLPPPQAVRSAKPQTAKAGARVRLRRRSRSKHAAANTSARADHCQLPLPPEKCLNESNGRDATAPRFSDTVVVPLPVTVAGMEQVVFASAADTLQVKATVPEKPPCEVTVRVGAAEEFAPVSVRLVGFAVTEKPGCHSSSKRVASTEPSPVVWS